MLLAYAMISSRFHCCTAMTSILIVDNSRLDEVYLYLSEVKHITVAAIQFLSSLKYADRIAADTLLYELIHGVV